MVHPSPRTVFRFRNHPDRKKKTAVRPEVSKGERRNPNVYFAAPQKQKNTTTTHISNC
jgi:hypothetical protein